MKKLKLNNKFLLLAGVLVSTLITLLSFTPGHATDNYIQISPTTEDIELEPGQTYAGSVRVQNIGDNDFEYKMSAQPFTYGDEEYSISVGAKGNNASFFEISDWINFSKNSGTLAAHEKETIDYIIKVPNDAPGGGQYVAIIAGIEGNGIDKNGANIRTVSQVADLIFAKVSGETNECAKIHSNSINTFMFEPPITATSLIEDCGNVHLYAKYIIKVYSLFSDTPIYSNEDDPAIAVIIPETRRFNTLAWTKDQGAPMMGIYNVEQTVKIGKETSTAKKLVFIFPLWLVIVIILFIGAVIFWLVSRSRQRKESKRSSVNTPDPSSD